MAICSPTPHPRTFSNVWKFFDCHSWRGATGIWRVEARNAAIHLTIHRAAPSTKNYLTQMSIMPVLRNSALEPHGCPPSALECQGAILLWYRPKQFGRIPKFSQIWGTKAIGDLKPKSAQKYVNLVTAKQELAICIVSGLLPLLSPTFDLLSTEKKLGLVAINSSQSNFREKKSPLS